MFRTYDFLIIGGGIVGLTLARELRKRHPQASIGVLEKEKGPGQHGSGRNSGVIHAGIYYAPGSLKAKLSVEGAAAFRDYCREYDLPIAHCGKVIVPTADEQQAQLMVLAENAKSNGVTVEIIDGAQLRTLEPEASPSIERALYSPLTCVVDPKVVVKHVHGRLLEAGVEVLTQQEVRSIDPKQRQVRCGSEVFSYGYLFNAAGAHADLIAKQFGLGSGFRILPFRGSYFELDASSGLDIKANIYPVPDPRVPFLGVHFTRSIAGTVYIGPTAFPAFGREHYEGVGGVEWQGLPGTLSVLTQQYWANRQGFRQLVHQESGRLLKSRFLEGAKRLVPRLKEEHLVGSHKVGIRAQLFDLKKKELVMDFLVEQGEQSVHVLNAISPAFTCSFRFANHILDNFALGI